MHARPAGQFVKLAGRCASSIEVVKGDTAVNMRRMMAVMGLCLCKGETVTFRVEGSDEDAVIEEVRELCQKAL